MASTQLIRLALPVLLPLLLMGCTDPSSPEPESPAADAGARYLALGDSYTIGESVPADARWPVQLVAALRAEGIDIADPQIIAQTGWTTDELSTAIAAAEPRGPFDLVTLLIGVNNQYRGGDAEEYRAQFRDLLEQSIAFAGGGVVGADRVIVLSIPDWGVTPFGQKDPRRADSVAVEIDQFNAIAREETERLGATFVDITPVSRTALGAPKLTASDSLHPSGPMYALWAELALPAARRALAGDGSTATKG